MLTTKSLVASLVALFFLATTALAGGAKTYTIDLGSTKIQVTPPEKWVQQTPGLNAREPVLADAEGHGARMITTATGIKLSPAATARMHGFSLDEARRRADRKDLVLAEDKPLDGIPGVLVVDRSCYPYRTEMIWTGHGPMGVLNFTLYAEPEFFDGYVPAFRALLDTVRFSK
jgi:hypothetical protein